MNNHAILEENNESN